LRKRGLLIQPHPFANGDGGVSHKGIDRGDLIEGVCSAAPLRRMVCGGLVAKLARRETLKEKEEKHAGNYNG
jgi:hypothetical protein